MASKATPLVSADALQQEDQSDYEQMASGEGYVAESGLVSGDYFPDGELGEEGRVFCTPDRRHSHVHMVKCYSSYPEAKYQMYWRFLSIVALFYAIPSFQFVWSSYRFFGRLHHDEPDDSRVCRYNAKCYHTMKIGAVKIPAINLILSNLGYVFFGVVFMIIVSLARPRRGYGLPEPVGMYYALGFSLVLEGMFSGLYHVCPTNQIFQFDTTFMIVGSIFLLSILYAKRHARIGLSAYKLMLSIALMVFTNLVWVLTYKKIGRLFWILPIIAFAFMTGLVVRAVISTDLISLITCRGGPGQIRKKARAIIGLVVLVNVWTVLILAVIFEPMFFNVCLGVILMNSFIYLTYYMIHKIVKGEKIYLFVWFMFFLAFVCGGVAVTFYVQPTYNTAESLAESEKLAEKCILFDFFDKHDLWHLFSACGIFCLMIVVYFLDHDLRNTPHEEIYVF